MTQATQKPPKILTFEEYVDFCAQTDESYELIHGELQKLNPPILFHRRLAKFLVRLFDAECKRIGLNWEAFWDIGQKTEEDSSRLPDVIVAPSNLMEPLMSQTAIFQFAAPLVIEIVSPSSSTDDYKAKVKEYQALGILEYWVLDPDALGAAKYIGHPKLPTVSIYSLFEGQYQITRFRGSDSIKSPLFPKLKLTAEQVLSAGAKGDSGNDQ